MPSQTSLIASDVRLQEWAMQIRECQNRPADMDVKTWCEQNHLTKSNYYYRLRKVRESLLSDLQQPDLQTPFVELQQHSQADTLDEGRAIHSDIGAFLVLDGKCSIQLSNQASEHFLRNLIGVIRSC